MGDQSLPSNNSTPLNIYQKIIKVMNQVDYVVKGSTVSTGVGSAGYKAVSHDDVTGLLHKPCVEFGIVIVPSIVDSKVSEIIKEVIYNNKTEKKISYRADVWVDVTFINADNPDERIISKSFAYAMDSSDKATGKAYSMAVKYAYLKTFMLESGDNEETRDFEGNNGGSSSNRNNGQNRTANGNSQNHSSSNGNNANNQRNSHVNDHKRNTGNGNTSTGQSGDQKSNDQKNVTQSPASENQIRAIQNICQKKGIEIGEKFKSAQGCTSQEASQEISRINAIKGQG